MNRITYKSALTPEQIRVRLYALAKPADSFGWRMSGKASFFFRFYNQQRFFLIKTHPGRNGAGAMNQPVFLGKLTKKDDVTFIESRFGWEYGKLIFSLLLIGILLFFTCRNIYMLMIAAIFIAIGSFFFLALASSFYREEEKAVIELIEKHLLS